MPKKRYLKNTQMCVKIFIVMRTVKKVMILMVIQYLKKSLEKN